MSKNGSKALRNMLPNSRMDRQYRPKIFFREKDWAEDPERKDLKYWKNLKAQKEKDNA